MPQGFAFPDRQTALWTPFAFTPEQRSDAERGNEYSASIGRLKPGATVAELDAQFKAIVNANADRIAAADPTRADDAAFDQEDIVARALGDFALVVEHQ